MLRPATEQLWNFLREQPALSGFVLIGGSALSLRIQHRYSEDLDLAFPDHQLPRMRLEALLRLAPDAGFHFRRDDHEAALQEFLLAGMELHDYQQNFVCNETVKVSFFAPDASLLKVLEAPEERNVRLASLAELFKSKCLVSALRSKTRDWLDLYLLLRDYGFSIQDYQNAFREAGVERQSDIGLARLCSGVPQKNDEGYAHLMVNPPTLEEMRAFFIEQRNQLEIETAERILRNKPGQEKL